VLLFIGVVVHMRGEGEGWCPPSPSGGRSSLSADRRDDRVLGPRADERAGAAVGGLRHPAHLRPPLPGEAPVLRGGAPTPSLPLRWWGKGSPSPPSPTSPRWRRSTEGWSCVKGKFGGQGQTAFGPTPEPTGDEHFPPTSCLLFPLSVWQIPNKTPRPESSMGKPQAPGACASHWVLNIYPPVPTLWPSVTKFDLLLVLFWRSIRGSLARGVSADGRQD